MREIVAPDVSAEEARLWIERRRSHATDDDYDEVLTGPTVIRDTSGTPLLVYLDAATGGVDLDWLGQTIHDRVPPMSGIRTGGLPIRSRQFGSRPRYPLRVMEHCSESTLRREDPEVFDQLLALGAHFADLYREWRPDLYAGQVERVTRDLRPEYGMVGPFTSGIINFESALPYHRDSGNFPDTWNVMATLRSGTEGGLLVVPSMRLALDSADGMVSLFDAQRTIHGVTPVSKRQRDGYRISIVYYCLKALCNCLAPDEEIARARRKRTEREERRAGLIP